MKLVHSLVYTPRRCGLYETAREIIEAEIKLGHDAIVIDPQSQSHVGHKDRGITVHGHSALDGADVIIDHSGLSATMRESGLPVIHVRHGRPHSSFLTEHRGGLAVYSHLARIASDSQYQAFVTFWPEHIPYWELLLGRDVSYVPSCVDLERYTPDGPSGYDFHGHRGERNIVCTDIWRDDLDPYHVIHAVAWAARKNPGLKLHLYGNPVPAVLQDVLSRAGCLGECGGWVRGLDNVFRAADLLVTGAPIFTRSIREAAACGLGWVRLTGDIDLDAARVMTDGCVSDPRAFAERSFNPALTAGGMIELALSCAGVNA